MSGGLTMCVLVETNSEDLGACVIHVQCFEVFSEAIQTFLVWTAYGFGTRLRDLLGSFEMFGGFLMPSLESWSHGSPLWFSRRFFGVPRSPWSFLIRLGEIIGSAFKVLSDFYWDTSALQGKSWGPSGDLGSPLGWSLFANLRTACNQLTRLWVAWRFSDMFMGT